MEQTRARYIGGSRNLGGAVTRTVGVNASNAMEARIRIAEKLTMLNKRFGDGHKVNAAEIGIIKVTSPETSAQSVGILA